jgi:outer membrane protein
LKTNRQAPHPTSSAVRLLRFTPALLMLATAPNARTQQNAVLQTAPASRLTLTSVVENAGRDYPLIHITQDELNASVANIRLARTAYLPRVDGIAQVNRATRNNVFGALLPQNTVPNISGPVIGSNNGGSVWGSAVGLLINWQPFDFGLRHARVEAASAARDKADATAQLTQLEVTTAAADAFLTVAVADQAKQAAQSAVDNWETLRQSIHALASAELRPGADESRIEAEKAAAGAQLALAQEAVDMGQATLTKFLLKADVAPSELDTTRILSSLPPEIGDVTPFEPASHPIMSEQRALVSQSAAELRATERTWVPQVNLEAAGYGRGTGAETNGQRLGGSNGLTPTVGNYAVGVNITFPFLDFASIHARESSQAATLEATKAHETLAGRLLQEQYDQARASLRATRAIAANTPIQVSSAQTSLAQANARYKAGLTSIDDVAQSQRLMVQAQIDDSIARLNVWRAFLQLQAVRGNLQPFLQAATQ